MGWGNKYLLTQSGRKCCFKKKKGYYYVCVIKIPLGRPVIGGPTQRKGADTKPVATS